MKRPQPSAAPLFFSKPVIITSVDHAETTFRPEFDYSFCSKTNSIPLAVSEFEIAACSYPIVFSSGDDSAALAVTGFTAEKNLFVDEENQWDARSYIPAYVRKYPFLFLESDDGASFTLCIEKKNLAGNADDPRMFEAGEPSDIVKKNLEFCTNFHASWALTKKFVSDLADLDLLVERKADIQLPKHANLSLNGFRVIDREKYEQLADSKLAELPRAYIFAIHCHLISMSRWQNLLFLASK
jgi:hypothetical protein